MTVYLVTAPGHDGEAESPVGAYTTLDAAQKASARANDADGGCVYEIVLDADGAGSVIVVGFANDRSRR